MRTIRNIDLSYTELSELHFKIVTNSDVIPHMIFTAEGWVTPVYPTCWEYDGKWHDGKGHKKIKYKGRTYYVHRIMYLAKNGIPPDGHVIDHTCRNPACCNPEHLEAVPVKLNTERGNGKWIFEQGYEPGS